MNPLEEQTEVLNELAQILHSEAGDDYDFVMCEYEFLERYNTISSSLKLSKNGREYYKEMSSGAPSQNAELAFKLRTLMKAHTGGEWESFTLKIDDQGKAHTKFYYPAT